MENYIITFPMFLSGGLAMFVTGFWFWINRQNANQAKAEAAATEERKAKEEEIRDSFAKIRAEMAERREKIHMLEMMLQATIRREEMERIYGRMEDIRKELGEDVRSQMSQMNETMRAQTSQVMSALAALLQKNKT